MKYMLIYLYISYHDIYFCHDFAFLSFKFSIKTKKKPTTLNTDKP